MTSPRGDEAVRLVPRNALVYGHANVEPNSDQWRFAGEVVRKLPTLRRLRERALRSLSRGDRALDFDTSVRPWIGDEAALALLPDGRRASSLILVRVADQARARDFLRGAGRPREQRHRGVTVRSYGTWRQRSWATSSRSAGPSTCAPRSTRAAARSLGDDSLFRDAVRGLEAEDPIAYAYASQDGRQPAAAPAGWPGGAGGRPARATRACARQRRACAPSRTGCAQAWRAC